jgi:DeoR/GlpR family transcriptional regulator of sugar metabolism
VYAEERRHVIAEEARRDGRVDVAVLAGRFDVTTETIRRDLTDLEARGVVRRVHGGAIPVERFRGEPALAEKAARLADEKRRIAKQALALVPESCSTPARPRSRSPARSPPSWPSRPSPTISASPRSSLRAPTSPS